MAKAGNWNCISLTNFLTLWTLTNHFSLSRDAKWRGWAGWLNRSIPAREFRSLNRTSNLTSRTDGSSPFGPSLLEGVVYVHFAFWWFFFFFFELTLLCTHGSRFRKCSQTMSGSSRRHPSILFIKLGFSIIANMQWLESWGLDTLESLSTFEIGSTFTQRNRKTF